jgi:mannose-1-phosphate guanylyltransferase
MPMYAVILAGGGGTRLRPLSRADRPKPFLPLIDDRTLIQHTLDRLPRRLSGAFVVVSPALADLVRTQVPDAEIVLEPEGRNTAAAIALATLAIDRPDDEVMAVLPADHVIRAEDVFGSVLGAAEGLARGAFGIDRPLVTLGVGVARPATEYGYLIPEGSGELVAGLRAHRLRAFEEKPTLARAEELATRPGVAWNAGMFLWQRGAIREALATYSELPMASEAALRAAYPTLRTRSIDYEVMEPAARDGRVLMASMDVGWIDIGGWTALLEEIGAHGVGRVAEAGEAVELAAGDLLVRGGASGLDLTPGPGTIAVDAPSAVLTGSGDDRRIVQALLDRVAAAENERP